MIRALLRIGLATGRMLSCALLCGSAFGQPAGNTPVFGAADIHVSGRNAGMSSALSHGHYELHSATMVDLIETAYGVDADQVLGGPNWLDEDRFDVIAKSPVDATPDRLKIMLQTLLADRFKLVVHNDTRPMQGYVLSAGNEHPGLRKADGSGDSGCNPESQTGRPQPFGAGSVPSVSYLCRNVTMAAFADTMRSMAGTYLDGSRVMDQTGLKGAWDFNLKWTAKSNLKSAGADGVTLFDALDQQLGIKMALSRVALPVIVVDSVNQKPTDNPPGVKVSLPALPAEFEVAEIKRSGRDSGQRGGPFQSGYRVELRGYTLSRLIGLAWGMDGADMITGGPGFAYKEQFDIVAKAPVITPVPGAPAARELSADALHAMLRALLADRFGLETHMEARPAIVYSLVAARPRLQKADPSERTSCTPAGTQILMVFECRNLTMAQLAAVLPKFSPGDLAHPVVDATQMEGAWDFTLSFTPAALARGGGAGGALTLPEAVDKELGLKLVMQRRRVQVVVIDHVEAKPTDN